MREILTRKKALPTSWESLFLMPYVFRMLTQAGHICLDAPRLVIYSLCLTGQSRLSAWPFRFLPVVPRALQPIPYFFFY